MEYALGQGNKQCAASSVCEIVFFPHMPEQVGSAWTNDYAVSKTKEFSRKKITLGTFSCM